MSAQQNAALVRRYFEECVSPATGPDQARALEQVDELLADDFAMAFNNDPAGSVGRGREDHKNFIANHARVYPDDHWTIESLVADGDTVACLWHFQSKHAKTGNRIDARAADFWRVLDGRLAELRRFLDFKSLDSQAKQQG